MKVTLGEVKAGYNAIKKLAKKEFKKGNFDKSLDYIDKAATVASQIMWRYADEELDDLHQKIAEKLIKSEKGKIQIKDNKVIFYDYFGSTFILAIQYIKALSKLNYHILYVYEEQNWDINVSVLEIMEKIPNVEICIIPKNISKSERVVEIYNAIVTFKPSKLFLHINTLSDCLPALHVLPSTIIKYYINLGDHAFWLGSKAINYSFEFRCFGAVLSYEKRGLSKDKLLLLPYYPIINGYDFQGFPKDCDNKVVIFSGGDFYKMVDANNTYWELVKAVLNQNPEAVMVFAIKILNQKGEEFLDNFIKENNFEKRFFPIGFRPDINEVFKHCDIFMGTCPMSGGLMSQYAAFNSKPILQYYPEELFAFEETESMICFNNKLQISYTNKNEFLIEAKKLIQDADYRIQRGAELHHCLITEKQFDALFAETLKTHKSQVEILSVDVNYKALSKWWLDVNNCGFSDVGKFIYDILGKKVILSVPSLYFRYFFTKIVRKIKKIYN